IFQRLFAAGGRAQARTTFQPAGGGSDEEERAAASAEAAAASTLDTWKAAARKKEGLSGLGGVYASSLYLLGECLASSCVPSSALEDDCRQGRRKNAAETLRASAEAFLYVRNHSRALPPLLRLVEVLRRRLAGGAGRHHGEEDEVHRHSLILGVEELCDRASSGLRLPTEVDADGDDPDEDRLQLDQIREGIAGLLRAAR
ncbi:unnamed protein product, partial [Ectocarpus sp. 12 AP-2014]